MDALKGYIVTSGLKPGDPLPTEAVLTEALGVSRSSVREALRKLEALDIVKVSQGRGSVVGQMSLQPMVETLVLRYMIDNAAAPASLREVIAVRRFLDMGVAENMVAAMKGTTNPELERLVETMVEKAGRAETYMDEDKAFHEGMNAYLGNELMMQLTSAMWLVHQTFVPELDPQSSGTLQRTARAHAMLLQTAQDGDLDGYKKALVEHYEPLLLLLKRSDDDARGCNEQSA